MPVLSHHAYLTFQNMLKVNSKFPGHSQIQRIIIFPFRASQTEAHSSGQLSTPPGPAQAAEHPSLPTVSRASATGVGGIVCFSLFFSHLIVILDYFIPMCGCAFLLSMTVTSCLFLIFPATWFSVGRISLHAKRSRETTQKRTKRKRRFPPHPHREKHSSAVRSAK